MNNPIVKYLSGILFVALFSGNLLAQTTISGTVTDADSGESLIGVNILVKGSVLGTITDVSGDFNLNITSAPPITLVITSVGYERQELEITQSSVSGLKISMKESFLLGQEVVISASRVEESILQSPVSIEKMDILAVQNTSSDSYYKAIANLKGVDVASSSINFQIINARGFGNTGNTRFVQLIDGMDTQAPALNFPIGNLNGPSELDVESVELIPGASSALYGPSAFNGVLLINSKSAFDYQGASAFVKTGVNHVGDATLSDHSPAPMYEASLRYAKAFNNKFAFKINGSYSRAEDWHGTDRLDRNAANNPFTSIGGDNPGSDRLHYHGDEAGINLAIFPFSSAFGAISRTTQFSNGQFASEYVNKGDLPNQVATLTPYKEADLIDYGAENKKISAGLYYRLTDNVELSYLYNAGFGTSIYTGAQRYSLKNFGIQQHRIQLRGDNFYLRTYGTFENSGNSYITELLAKRVNDLMVGYNFGQYHLINGQPFNPFENRKDGVIRGDLTGYLVDYGVEYLRSLSDQGYAAGAVQNLSAEQQLAVQQQAHNDARSVVDSRYIIDPNGGTVVDPQTGETLTFDQVKKRALVGTIPNGPSFADKSAMYHTEGQYDFKNEISFMELQVGGSYRIYDLGSKGTIFPDTVGNEISINEYGVYTQAAKRVSDYFKLSGSIRYDKNQNFKGQVNPRLSGVFTVNKNHNFRASIQRGFRFPTTQGQYINLDVLSSRLLGGLPEFYEQYLRDPNRTYFQGGSVIAFRNAIFAGTSVDQAAADQLQTYTYSKSKYVKPESVRSLELGYKSLVLNKLLVDGVYFFNVYSNFITQENVIAANNNADGTPNYLTVLTSNGSNTYSIYTNLDNTVKTQGAALGLTYSLSGGYTVGGNYSWNKFISGYNSENILKDFNTPEHKFNLNVANRKITDKIGASVTYRWQQGFHWESSFARGEVPAYQTVDAQVSYKLKQLNSMLKLGGSNIFQKYYLQSLGGPNIGAIYYVSITFDELMN